MDKRPTIKTLEIDVWELATILDAKPKKKEYCHAFDKLEELYQIMKFAKKRQLKFDLAVLDKPETV
jgi:uncharacterized protein (DUF433 family)